MHDVLRQRLLRKIEALPEERIYQVLDYIEFLESKYGETDIEEEVTGLRRFAERLEDGLRRRTVRPGTLREAFQLLSAADRVLSGVATAGRDLLDQLEPEAGGSTGAAGGSGVPRAGGRRPNADLPSSGESNAAEADASGDGEGPDDRA